MQSRSDLSAKPMLNQMPAPQAPMQEIPAQVPPALNSPAAEVDNATAKEIMLESEHAQQ